MENFWNTLEEHAYQNVSIYLTFHSDTDSTRDIKIKFHSLPPPTSRDSSDAPFYPGSGGGEFSEGGTSDSELRKYHSF